MTNNHQGHDKVAQLTCMFPDQAGCIRSPVQVRRALPPQDADASSAGRIRRNRTRTASPRAALLLEENQIWWERQQRLVVLHGFFDDSLAAAFVWSESSQALTTAEGETWDLVSVEGLLPDIIRAILTVADDIGLETAAHKIELGTDDGRAGTIAIDAWRQDRAAGLPPTSCRILWDLRPGFMVALGKELDLRLQRVRDTRTRVDELASDIRELVKHANRQRHGGRPTVPIATLWSIIGR